MKPVQAVVWPKKVDMHATPLGAPGRMAHIEIWCPLPTKFASSLCAGTADCGASAVGLVKVRDVDSRKSKRLPLCAEHFTRELGRVRDMVCR